MSPQYLRELADMVDPDQLWRHSWHHQMSLPPEKRRQLDAGIALRRYAHDQEAFLAALANGKSLRVVPLGTLSRAVHEVATPAKYVEQQAEGRRRYEASKA